jgi:hypothetical protein
MYSIPAWQENGNLLKSVCSGRLDNLWCVLDEETFSSDRYTLRGISVCTKIIGTLLYERFKEENKINKSMKLEFGGAEDETFRFIESWSFDDGLNEAIVSGIINKMSDIPDERYDIMFFGPRPENTHNVYNMGTLGNHSHFPYEVPGSDADLWWLPYDQDAMDYFKIPKEVMLEGTDGRVPQDLKHFGYCSCQVCRHLYSRAGRDKMIEYVTSGNILPWRVSNNWIVTFLTLMYGEFEQYTPNMRQELFIEDDVLWYNHMVHADIRCYGTPSKTKLLLLSDSESGKTTAVEELTRQGINNVVDLDEVYQQRVGWPEVDPDNLWWEDEDELYMMRISISNVINEWLEEPGDEIGFFADDLGGRLKPDLVVVIDINTHQERLEKSNKETGWNKELSRNTSDTYSDHPFKFDDFHAAIEWANSQIIPELEWTDIDDPDNTFVLRGTCTKFSGMPVLSHIMLTYYMDRQQIMNVKFSKFYGYFSVIPYQYMITIGESSPLDTIPVNHYSFKEFDYGWKLLWMPESNSYLYYKRLSKYAFGNHMHGGKVTNISDLNRIRVSNSLESYKNFVVMSFSASNIGNLGKFVNKHPMPVGIQTHFSDKVLTPYGRLGFYPQFENAVPAGYSDGFKIMRTIVSGERGNSVYTDFLLRDDCRQMCVDGTQAIYDNWWTFIMASGLTRADMINYDFRYLDLWDPRLSVISVLMFGKPFHSFYGTTSARSSTTLFDRQVSARIDFINRLPWKAGYDARLMELRKSHPEARYATEEERIVDDSLFRIMDCDGEWVPLDVGGHFTNATMDVYDKNYTDIYLVRVNNIKSVMGEEGLFKVDESIEGRFSKDRLTGGIFHRPYEDSIGIDTAVSRKNTLGLPQRSTVTLKNIVSAISREKQRTRRGLGMRFTQVSDEMQEIVSTAPTIASRINIGR